MRSLVFRNLYAWAVAATIGLAALSLPLAAADSVVRAVDVSIPRGETNRVLILLTSQGNENAVAFSLCYDTNQLAFVRAVRGVDSTNAAATLVVGTSQVSRGRVGMLLGLDVGSGQVFTAGTNQILEVHFRAAAGSGVASAPISFCDLPTTREISDVDALPLPATYVSATATLVGGCSYVLGATQASLPAAGGSNTVAVTTAAGCDWTASSALSWVAIVSGASGNGNGTVVLAVQPNLAATPRSGSVKIAGQAFTVNQAAAACSFSLSPTNRNHGSGVASNSFSIATDAACAWTVVTTNTWIALPALTAGTGSATVDYVVSANPGLQERVGYLLVGDQVLTLRQAGLTCSYSLSPTNRNHGSGTASNSVNVAADAACPWTATTSNVWIALVPPVTATGPGAVGYQLAANLSAQERVGYIQIADQVLTVRQAGLTCTYSLSPTNRTHGSGTASNSVSLTTDAGCTWTALTTNDWITLTSAAAGTGPASISYALSANPSLLERVGYVQVGDQVLTLRQSGMVCTYSLSPTNRNHGYGTASNAFSISTGTSCPWTASTTNAWITITSVATGMGPATVSYALSANPNPVERLGGIAVGDQVLTLRQSGITCAYGLSPTNRSHGSGVATNTFTITTGATCPWTVTNTNGWILLLSSATGTGTGIVTYAVLENTGPTERTGVVTVAGLTLTLRQSGVTCSYSLSPASRNHGYGVATNSFSVAAGSGCPWTAVTTHDWITVQAGAAGNGSGSVTYAVAANPAGAARTGSVQVANTVFSIVQDALPCSFVVSPASRTHGFAAATNTFSVTTVAGCAWTLVNTSSWVTVLGPGSGSGSSTLTYTVAPNPLLLERWAVLALGGETLVLTQRAASCAFDLSPTNVVHGSGMETGAVTVATATNCSWSASTTNSWITLGAAASGNGSGRVSYVVAANPANVGRVGYITLGGEVVTIAQAGINCAYRLSPTNRTHGYAATSNYFSVAAAPECSWAAVASANWITLVPGSSGAGDGSVGYLVAANPLPTERTGLVTVADQTFALVQLGTPCTASLSPNSRTHGSGAASNTVALTTLVGCTWQILNTNAWISFAQPTSGSGSAVLAYSIAENPEGRDRVGTVDIAGETLVITQRAATCTFALSATSRIHGYGTATNSVSLTTLATCPWTLVNTNPWIQFLAADSGTGSVALTYQVDANPFTQWRTGLVFIAGEVLTLAQRAAPCDYSLSVSNLSCPDASVTGQVAVATSSNCLWAATTTNSWIQILGAANGAGNGTATYVIAANATPQFRVGAITVGEVSLVITQAGVGCTITLTPSSRAHGYGEATGEVAVATLSGCPWSVVNTNPWVSLPAAAGNGPASLAYIVDANPGITPRSGYLVIGGQPLEITQAGAPCSHRLSPTNRTHGYGATTGSVAVASPTGCNWSATTSQPWITLLTGLSGNGDGTLTYALAANESLVGRTGAIAVADQTLVLVQQGVTCSFSLSPTTRTHGNGNVTNLFFINTLSACPWEVVNTNSWITLLSPATGQGSGLVQYWVHTNEVTLERVGALQVGSQSLVITQRASTCVFTLSSTNGTHGYASQTGEVMVATSTNCSWTVENTNAWITLLSPTNTVGSGVVRYGVGVNMSVSERSARLRVAGVDYMVTQPGSPCLYAASPAALQHGAGPATGTVSVTVASGCEWITENTNAWITIVSGLAGSGNGAVTYQVPANPTTDSRTGTVAIAGQVVTITQAGAACLYAISPLSRDFTHLGGAASLSLTAPAGCAWVATTTHSWVTLTAGAAGTGSGTVSFTVATNSLGLARTGYVSVAGQTFTIQQAAVPCAYAVTPPSRSHGYGTETGTVAVTTEVGCTWSVNTSNAWLTILGGATGSSSSTLTYVAAANPTGLPRTGYLSIGGSSFLISQAAGPCSYAISPTNLTAGALGGPVLVSVLSPLGCLWTVTNTYPWITVTSGSSGTNAGPVELRLDANPITYARTGVVTIANQRLVVIQEAAPCTATLTPATFAHGAGAETGLVSVVTSANCSWAVTNTNSWITITSGAARTGNGSFGYSVAANPTGLSRSGQVRVLDQVFTVTQAAAPCTYGLAASSASHGSGAAVGSITVTTLVGCAWSAVTTNAWLVITAGSPATNNGTATYAVLANPNGFARTGWVSVAGLTFTVVQAAAPCTFSLSVSGRSHEAGVATGSVDVVTLLGCPWSISNTVSWLTVSGGTTRTNSGTVFYTLAPNPTGLGRTGVVTLAGQPYTVTQAAAPCTYTLAPITRGLTYLGETGTLTLTTLVGCAWSVGSSPAWISFIGPTAGTNTGTIGYRAASNDTALARTGMVTVAGQTCTVIQGGAPCSFTLGSLSRTHGAGMETGSVTVTTLTGCSWTGGTTNDWITVTAGSLATNSGAASYVVSANPTSYSRTGVVTVAGQAFTVVQSGAPCTFALSPTSRTHGFGAETNSIAVTTLLGCSWSVGTTQSWITLSGGTNRTNSGSVTYSLQANPSSLARTGSLSVAGQSFPVVQAGAPCVFTLTPSARAHGFGSETGTVSVTAPLACDWTAAAGAPWLTVLGLAAGSGSGGITYAVEANPTIQPRSGTLTMAGQTFTVTQAGAPCTYALSPATWMHRSGADTGSVAVSSLAGCDWTVVNTNTWIALTAGTAGSGGGGFTYTVTTNAGSATRTGWITVGGQGYAVTQLGSACGSRLSPTNRYHGFGAATNTISVTANTGCSWSVLNTNSWISLLSGASGSGAGTVTYAVTANRAGEARYALLNIGGESFTLTQWGTNCGLALMPVLRSHGYGADTGQVVLSASSSTCAWAIKNTNSWITVQGAASGLGGTTLTYTVAINWLVQPRTGVFTVGLETFTVQQAGITCTWALTPVSRHHPATASSNVFTVTTPADCPWTIQNTNAWVTVLTGGGTGNGTVSYLVDSNPTALPRSGYVVVAGQAFAVTQDPAPCSFAVEPAGRNHGSGADAGLFSINTLEGCTWSIVNTNPWVTLSAGASGSNSASILYTLDANPSALSRTGSLVVAGQLYTITQSGSACAYTLTPASPSHGAGSETGLVSVGTLAGCNWSISNPHAWITLSPGAGGIGPGTVAYALQSNPSVMARTGLVSIAGQTLSIRQAGLACTYTLAPESVALGRGAGSGTLAVTSASGCAWTASTSNSWIQITAGATGTGDGTVSYTVATNAGGQRAGVITVAGRAFTLNQEGSLRLVRAVDMSVGRGQTNRLLVVLESQGDENALGFSLCFDTNRLTFLRAVRGVDATNAAATMNTNLLGSARGQLGFAFGLDIGSGQTFLRGSNVLAEVYFRAAPGTTVASTTVGVCDTPVAREVSDVFAEVLPASYTGGTVTLLAPCTFALGTNAATLPAGGGSSSVAVLADAGCAWTVVNPISWITVAAGNGGSGSGTVLLQVQPNGSAQARTGQLSIAGQAFTVTQSGAVCTYGVSPTNLTHHFSSETGLVQLVAPEGCAWTVENTNSWILLDPAATNGTGSVTLGYSVAANASLSPRTGLLTVGGVWVSVTQAGAPCVYVLSPANRSLPSSGGTGLVSVATPAGCTWGVTSTESWLTVQAAASTGGNGSFAYQAAMNYSAQGRTGIIAVAGQAFVVTQAGSTCGYAILPASRNHGYPSATGSVSVTAATGCSWEVINPSSWITVTTPMTGAGPGTVTYVVSANPGGSPRSATLTIAGSSFTVSQDPSPCAFAIAPSTVASGEAGATGSVSVATFSSCAWNAIVTNTWITVRSPSNGVGVGNFTYAVQANPNGASRTGFVVVADQVLVVTQAGQPCTYAVSPSSRLHGSGMETNQISVSTLGGCPWTVSNGIPWVTVLSSTNGSGSGLVTYAVAANPTGLPRSGTVLVAGQPISLTQAGATCTFTLSAASRSFVATGGTAAVNVATLTGCSWTVQNGTPWIQVTSGTAGTGSGTVAYTVLANNTAYARTGTVLMAGQSHVVTQAPASCSYALDPVSAAFASDGGTSTVLLTTLVGCPFTAVSSNSWITLTGATNGTGPVTLDYSVLANPTSSARTGLVQVAGQSLVVVQDGAPCRLALSPTNRVIEAAGGAISVTVTVPDGCPWAVTVTNAWMALTTAASGTGNGVVGLTIQANSSPYPRSACVSIGGVPFEVSQQGIACTYAITPTNQVLSSGNVTGLISIATSSGCTWSTVNTNPWIAIKAGESGIGNGLVRYTVAANPNPSPRSGYLVVGGQPHSVTQLGTPCTYSLSPTNRLHGSGSETGLVSVFTVQECSWTAVTSNSWITLLNSNGAGNATFTYQLQPNPTANDRVGYLSVANQAFAITQLGAPCSFNLAPTNYAHGPGAETNTLAVNVLPGCTWTVTKTNTWITILSSASGSGTGTVTYAVAANVSLAARSGVLRVGGAPYTVTQDGMLCTWTLGATNGLHSSSPETGSIAVTTTNSLCPWTASTTNAWITFPAGTNFVGSGTVAYAVAGNPSPIGRYGVITLAGQTYVVAQAGINCTYSLFPPLRTHSYLSETSVVAVTTSNLCQWAVQNTNGWITVLGPTNYSSSVNLIYVVQTNPATNSRSGNLLIAGTVFPITQAGLFFVCPTNRTVECGQPWSFDQPVPTGGCTNPGSTITPISTLTNAASSCGGGYVATRIWQAVDACGGTLSCTQTVSVVDTTAPGLACALDKAVECGSAWAFDLPTVFDSCSGTNVTLRILSTVTNRVDACGGGFRTTRTWEALDGCGNRAVCAQTVVVTDLTPPVLTCVSNRTVECLEAWAFDEPSAVDACSGAVTVRILGTVTNVSCGTTFTATRTWEAVDGCTNRSTCSQTVRVVDTQPPTFTCPPTKLVECGQAWSFDAATATDACGTVTVSVFSTITNTAGFCGSTRSITRTWQAIDACGNTNFCSQLVRIVDTAAPVLVCLPTRTVEFGVAWTFDNPTVYDSCSGTNVTLRILSTVTNTSGFCAGAYAVTRTWQAMDGCSNQSATCAQTIRVMDTTPPVLVCAPNKMVQCTQPWSFDVPTAYDLASGTNVTLVVLDTVTNGICGGVFTATRTWRASDPCTNAATCSQTVTGLSTFTVSGVVSYPAGAGTELAVAGVNLAVSGATNLTRLSESNGAYRFTVQGPGSFTVTPTGGPTNSPSAGVSTLDISLIRRHVLSITNLDSPYKLLAADVNGSSSVSTLDISLIRRLILAATNNLPLGLWRYVPADYVFPNPASPWGAPTSRVATVSAQDVGGQSFLAVKLGDVNASWLPPVVPAGAFRPADTGGSPLEGPGGEVTLALTRHTARPGDSLTVAVTATGLRQVGSLQGTLAWDPTVLRYRALGATGLAGFTEACLGLQGVEQGQLAFSWDDPQGAGVTGADGTIVCSLIFEVIGHAGTMSPLAVTDTLTPREVGVNGTAGRLSVVSGQVLVVDSIGTQLAAPVYGGGTFQLPLATVAGKRYILEYTDALPATNWTALPALEGDGTVRTLVDPTPHMLRRFYRVRVE